MSGLMHSNDTRTATDRLRGDYLKLLDAGKPEQMYQSFLEENTKLIPREFVQNHGLHFDLVLRKIGFGADYNCDFFYMSKSSDDWNLVFIEIEKPQSRFFRSNSSDFDAAFNTALQQIGRWRAWLSQPANLGAFLETIEPIRLPHIMRRNPSYPKFVFVHGRRDEYAGNDQRRGMIRAQEHDDFKIITFDSLAENLHNKHECYIGVRHNETIHIQGDRMVAPDLLGWIEPTHFSVNRTLQAAIRAGDPGGFQIRRSDGTKFVDAFTYVADRIRVVDGHKGQTDTNAANEGGAAIF